MKILLFRGRGFLSRLIRWQTRSAYSHAAVLLDDQHIIEAWQGAGVRLKRMTDWADVDVFEPVVTLDAHQLAKVRLFLVEQTGRGYDYWGVLRFISRRRLPENGKWFCSELVFEAFRQAGMTLLERIDASEVSPQLLSLSPLLKEGTPPALK